MKFKVVFMITFLILSIGLVGCSEEERISEDKALEIAKGMNMNNSKNVEWKIEFKENAEIEPRKTSEAWVVEAVYPFGNKKVYYIDAITGAPSKVAEIEAP
jgi:uncharacterized cupredoxin-like copper-binding protein